MLMAGAWAKDEESGGCICMKSTGKEKRQLKPLGVFALVMAIIYTIPIIAMFFIRSQMSITLGLAAIPITLISYATAKTNFWKPPATNVKVSYLGHRCFQLACDDQVVFIDPYPAGSVPGLKPVKGKANLVLCSDGDESGAAQIKIKEAKRPLPFTVTEFEAADGGNKMFMLDNGDHRIVHLGALDCDLTEEQIAAFRGADILMVPVGGEYTIDEDEAADITLALLPEYVIPMSFQTAKYGLKEIGRGTNFASSVKEAWLETEGHENGHCPVTVRLAAKNGKERGLASVEVRNRDEIKNSRKS